MFHHKIAVQATLFFLILLSCKFAAADTLPIRIGWIGPITGPAQKYGAYQAARLAQEDINKAGGVNGKPLQIIFEDGQCNGRRAADAARKLIDADGVKVIIGGHCSPESIAIAPLAKKNDVLIIGAITTSSKLSIPEDNFYRLSANNTALVNTLAPFVLNKEYVQRVAIVNAETDYAVPPAEMLENVLREKGVTITQHLTFREGESDFKSLVLRLRQGYPDVIYIGVQSPDTALLMLHAFKNAGFRPKIIGNEAFGGGGFGAATGSEKNLFNEVVYAEPEFDPEVPTAKAFIKEFKHTYHAEGLPYGIWTAEAYDAVQLTAKLVRECGNNVNAVLTCISTMDPFNGVSGRITFDKNGDGVRTYVLKEINGGKVTEIR